MAKTVLHYFLGFYSDDNAQHSDIICARDIQ